jgi:AP2 domain
MDWSDAGKADVKPPTATNAHTTATDGSHARGHKRRQHGASVTPPNVDEHARAAMLSSRYTGVCWNKKNKRWQASINSGGKYLYLGSFTNESDAARMYDQAALKLRGLKTRTNFPVQNYLDSSGQLRPSAALDPVLAVHEQLVLTQRLATAQALALAGLQGQRTGLGAKRIKRNTFNDAMMASGGDGADPPHALVMATAGAAAAAAMALQGVNPQQGSSGGNGVGGGGGTADAGTEHWGTYPMPDEPLQASSLPLPLPSQLQLKQQMPPGATSVSNGAGAYAAGCVDGNGVVSLQQAAEAMLCQPVGLLAGQDSELLHHQALTGGGGALLASGSAGGAGACWPAQAGNVSGPSSSGMQGYWSSREATTTAAAAAAAAAGAAVSETGGSWMLAGDASAGHRPDMAAAVPVPPVSVVRMAPLVRQMPSGSILELLLPVDGGLCGVVYRMPDSPLAGQWHAALWDGQMLHCQVGSMSSEVAAVNAAACAVNRGFTAASADTAAAAAAAAAADAANGALVPASGGNRSSASPLAGRSSLDQLAEAAAGALQQQSGRICAAPLPFPAVREGHHRDRSGLLLLRSAVAPVDSRDVLHEWNGGFDAAAAAAAPLSPHALARARASATSAARASTAAAAVTLPPQSAGAGAARAPAWSTASAQQQQGLVAAQPAHTPTRALGAHADEGSLASGIASLLVSLSSDPLRSDPCGISPHNSMSMQLLEGLRSWAAAGAPATPPPPPAAAAAPPAAAAAPAAAAPPPAAAGSGLVAAAGEGAVAASAADDDAACELQQGAAVPSLQHSTHGVRTTDVSVPPKQRHNLEAVVGGSSGVAPLLCRDPLAAAQACAAAEAAAAQASAAADQASAGSMCAYDAVGAFGSAGGLAAALAAALPTPSVGGSNPAGRPLPPPRRAVMSAVAAPPVQQAAPGSSPSVCMARRTLECMGLPSTGPEGAAAADALGVVLAYALSQQQQQQQQEQLASPAEQHQGQTEDERDKQQHEHAEHSSRNARPAHLASPAQPPAPSLPPGPLPSQQETRHTLAQRRCSASPEGCVGGAPSPPQLLQLSPLPASRRLDKEGRATVTRAVSHSNDSGSGGPGVSEAAVPATNGHQAANNAMSSAAADGSAGGNCSSRQAVVAAGTGGPLQLCSPPCKAPAPSAAAAVAAAGSSIVQHKHRAAGMLPHKLKSNHVPVDMTSPAIQDSLLQLAAVLGRNAAATPHK